MLTRKGKESYRLEVFTSFLDFLYMLSLFNKRKRLLLTKKEVLFFENKKKNQISAASTNGETRDGSMNLTFLTQLKQIFVKQFL